MTTRDIYKTMAKLVGLPVIVYTFDKLLARGKLYYNGRKQDARGQFKVVDRVERALDIGSVISAFSIKNNRGLIYIMSEFESEAKA